VTLLVGVLCSNGVVIAADHQATHGGMGQQTVGQSVTKVQVINGEALYATSGHKGLGQQLHAIVERKQPEFTLPTSSSSRKRCGLLWIPPSKQRGTPLACSAMRPPVTAYVAGCSPPALRTA
jgi:Proteasome subunit